MKNKITLSRRFVLLALSAVIIFGVAGSRFAFADRFDEQIRELSSDNEKKLSTVSDLQVEADNLEQVISGLQAQIDTLQAQINENNAKSESLKIKIAEAEAELARQKEFLGQNIRAMYLSGDITTLEMLASSKDLSDFVDKEQYRNAVKDKIKDTLDKVSELKTQMSAQKNEIDRLLQEQSAMQGQISAQKAEQNRLLGMNQAQQDEFNSQIKGNKDKIAELKKQQVLENIRLFGGGSQPGVAGGGGYPWGNAYCVHTGSVGGMCPNYDWYFNGNPWDTWLYGYRNCTSWVAYKLTMDGKSGFSGLGNAAQWPGNAAARGYEVSYGSGARVGDAAVNPNGYYGHVMYVEAVNGSQVIVSDYNRLGDGLYRGPDSGSAAVINQSSLVFIHF